MLSYIIMVQYIILIHHYQLIINNAKHTYSLLYIRFYHISQGKIKLFCLPLTVCQQSIYLSRNGAFCRQPTIPSRTPYSSLHFSAQIYTGSDISSTYSPCKIHFSLYIVLFFYYYGTAKGISLNLQVFP